MSLVRWALVTAPLMLLLGFASGRSVPAGDRNDWYVALAKPALMPPGWAFAVAWSVLYILIGLALAVVLSARGAPLRRIGIGLFVMQLALNLAWTPVFFGAHRVLLAFILLAVLLLAGCATTIVFARVRVLAAWLMVPYLAWVCFAGALMLDILRLNPDAQTLVPGAHTSQML